MYFSQEAIARKSKRTELPCASDFFLFLSFFDFFGSLEGTTSEGTAVAGSDGTTAGVEAVSAISVGTELTGGAVDGVESDHLGKGCFVPDVGLTPLFFPFAFPFCCTIHYEYPESSKLPKRAPACPCRALVFLRLANAACVTLELGRVMECLRAVDACH
jgi:hypothetical protein